MSVETGAAPEVDHEFRVPIEERASDTEGRETVMERLDAKVESVLALQHTIESLDDETDSAKIEQALDDAWQQVTMTMPTETMSRYEQLQEMWEQLRTANQKMADYFDGHAVSEQEMATYRRRQLVLGNEVQHVLSDEGVEYLANVHGVLETLRKKQAQVRGFHADQEKILASFNRQLKHNRLGAPDVVQVFQHPFEISLIVTPQAYERVAGQDSFGRHLYETPLSIIKQHERADLTLRHEGIHNLIEGAPGIGDYDDGKRIAALQEHALAAKTPQQEQSVVAALDAYTPNQWLDWMQDELIAGFESWEGQIGNIRMNPLDQMKPFVFYVNHFGSVGSDAYDISRTLTTIEEKGTNQNIQSRAAILRQTFEQRFVQSIQYLQAGLEQATTIGPDAVDHLHAVLVVIPPSRYRLIKHYLDYKFPESKKQAA